MGDENGNKEPFVVGNYMVPIFIRKQDLKSPFSIRRRVNHRLRIESKNMKEFKPCKDEAKLNTECQKVPSFKSFVKYNQGISTNWTKFYKDVQLEGLVYNRTIPIQLPFDNSFKIPIWGMNLSVAVEDHVVIFQTNETDLCGLIISGSGKWNIDMLKKESIIEDMLFTG